MAKLEKMMSESGAVVESQKVSDEWVCVPKNLTFEMRAAYAENSIAPRDPNTPAPLGPISTIGYDAMLAAAPAAPVPAEQGWISVDDRLPEIDYTQPEYRRTVRVLAAWGPGAESVAEMRYASNGFAATERGRAARFEWQGKISPWAVTHWMPLPAGPGPAN